MARGKIGKLNTSELRTKKAGLIADGGCLYLRTAVGQDGSMNRGWIFRYQLPGGRKRDMGLGSLTAIGLAMARKLAADNRELVATGVDPIERRNEIVSARRVAEAVTPPPTFDMCARDYIAAHEVGWRNASHRQQWVATLATYVSPLFGKLPVNEITVDHVLKVLQPHWSEKTNTMARVRNRIELVLDYATAMKKRPAGDNPARWSGNLKHLLAAPHKLAPVEHLAALDYRRMGEFMTALRQRQGVAALALEFTILTCARTGEALGATWAEIDDDEKVWIVPANRIKMGREHSVPLAKPALAVLSRVRAMTEKVGGANPLIFPSDRGGKKLSVNSMASVLTRMRYDDITVHGFRSAFRDWISETTNFPNDAAELALAHKVAAKTEAAYRRGSMFNKRRLMMEAWAGYCGKLPGADAKVLTFAKP